MGNAAMNEDLMAEDECISDDDDEIQLDPKVPVIRFPKPLKARIRSAWRNALIVKLVGYSYGFESMVIRLREKWHTVEFDTMYLGEGFFVCNFESQVECRRVLTGGPYFMGSHFLHVQKWRPNFRADFEQIKSMVVWVRFPNVSSEYFDEEAICLIAKEIGKPIKLDEVTAFASRGRFARVCVEIDLGKPLLTRVQINRKFVYIEYEGLPTICYSCGRVGHTKDACIHTIQRVNQNEKQPSPVGEGMQEDGMAVDGGAQAEQADPTPPEFGPWMQVSRRNFRSGHNRPRRSTNANMESAKTQRDNAAPMQNNRFAGLQDEGVNDSVDGAHKDLGVNGGIGDGGNLEQNIVHNGGDCGEENHAQNQIDNPLFNDNENLEPNDMAMHVDSGVGQVVGNVVEAQVESEKVGVVQQPKNVDGSKMPKMAQEKNGNSSGVSQKVQSKSSGDFVKRSAGRVMPNVKGGRTGAVGAPPRHSMSSLGENDYVQKVATVFKQKFSDIKAHPPAKELKKGQHLVSEVNDSSGVSARPPLQDVSQ